MGYDFEPLWKDRPKYLTFEIEICFEKKRDLLLIRTATNVAKGNNKSSIGLFFLSNVPAEMHRS